MPRRAERATLAEEVALGPPLPITTSPMEAHIADELPDGRHWQFEPKWDGFRCLAFREGDEVDLRAKSGKPLGRYFPEIVEALRSIKSERFVLDGELVVPMHDTLSFAALQMRLHPAESRIRRLAAETPALLILFDCLATSRQVLTGETLSRRRAALDDFFRKIPAADRFRLSPYTIERREALKWLSRASGAIDGVVAKPLDGIYEPGERRMIKVKQLRTADCVVGGFRYTQKAQHVGSLLLGLYNERGELDHVGFTSTLPKPELPALTRKLEALIAPPGFTGNAPGGPSRWSTARSADWQPLRPELVVEVRYDHVTADRFRHGTKLMRWRPDKAPAQCTFEQILRPAGPAELIAAVV